MTEKISEMLKAETKISHEKLHRLRYFEALMSGAPLELTSYVTQLRCLAIVTGMLEFTSEENPHPLVKSLKGTLNSKMPALLKDLRYFEEKLPHSIQPAIMKALGLVDEMMSRISSQPASWLGYAYVIEGSFMGIQVMLPKLEKYFSISSGKGGTAFTESLNARSSWVHFKETLDQVDSDELPVIIETAKQCFDGFDQMYSHLHPYSEKDLRTHVTTINPEAGNHPVPTDPHEIKVALRSAAKAWGTWPYLNERYGERGLRFSKSDSAWLILLAHSPIAAATTDIEWMAGMLAARGVPSMFLEEQLSILQLEARSIEGGEGRYDQLKVLSEKLKSERLGVLSEKEATALCERAMSEVGESKQHHHEKMVRIFTSSLCDEKLGRKGARNSVLNWVKESEKFPKGFVKVLEESVI